MIFTPVQSGKRLFLPRGCEKPLDVLIASQLNIHLFFHPKALYSHKFADRTGMTQRGGCEQQLLMPNFDDISNTIHLFLVEQIHPTNIIK